MDILLPTQVQALCFRFMTTSENRTILTQVSTRFKKAADSPTAWMETVEINVRRLAIHVVRNWPGVGLDVYMDNMGFKYTCKTLVIKMGSNIEDNHVVLQYFKPTKHISLSSAYIDSHVVPPSVSTISLNGTKAWIHGSPCAQITTLHIHDIDMFLLQLLRVFPALKRLEFVNTNPWVTDDWIQCIPKQLETMTVMVLNKKELIEPWAGVALELAFQYICPACGGAEDNTGYEEDCVCIVRKWQPWYKGTEIKEGDVIEGKYGHYGYLVHGEFKLICNGLVEELDQFDEKQIAEMKGILVDMYCKSCYDSCGPSKIESMLQEITDTVDHIKGVLKAMDSKGVKRKTAEPDPTTGSQRATKKARVT